MEVPNSKNGVSVRAYQRDAMTLLAFDLDQSKTKNFADFSVRITPGPRKRYYLSNLLTYPAAILIKEQHQARRRSEHILFADSEILLGARPGDVSSD